jgi:hypothetical protein
MIRGPGKHVSVNTEDCSVDARANPLELDDVYKGLNVGPASFTSVIRCQFSVAKIPELETETWELFFIV